MTASSPTSVLSRELLPASVAIYTMVALVAFEGLAVVAALPDVAAELGHVELLPWVITAYLLTSGIATVIAGPLVDALGARVMFRWAVGLFTLAGLACALVPTMPALVAARLLQGAGGGLVIAVGLASVSLVYPDHLVGRAFAANSTVWGAMGVAAPAIAAFMLTTLDWRWIFLINLPLGLTSLVTGWRVLPSAVGEESSRPDLLGTLLVAGFTVAALIGVDRLGIASIPWLVGGALVAAGYARHARRHARPVLRLEHVARQPYAGLALSLGLMLAGAVGANTYLPLYVQGGRGASSGVAAWSVLFFTIGWAVGSNIAGRLTGRMAESTVAIAGFGATVPALVAVWPAAASSAALWVVFGLFSAAGIGVGMSTNAGLTLLRNVTPQGQIGRAAAAHQFARNQGFTFGTALAGAVLLLVVGSRIGDVGPVQDLLAGGPAEVDRDVAGAVRAGFTAGALVSAATAALGILPMIALRRHLAPARRARGRRR